MFKLKKLGLFRKTPNRFYVSKSKEAESGGSSSIEMLTLDFNTSNSITLTDEQIDILLNTNPLLVSIKNFKDSVYEGDSAALKTNVIDNSSYYLINFNRFFNWFGQQFGSYWYGTNSLEQCVEQLQINKTTKEAYLMAVSHMNIPNLDKEKFDELYAPKKYLHQLSFEGYNHCFNANVISQDKTVITTSNIISLKNLYFNKTTFIANGIYTDNGNNIPIYKIYFSQVDTAFIVYTSSFNGTRYILNSTSINYGQVYSITDDVIEI